MQRNRSERRFLLRATLTAGTLATMAGCSSSTVTGDVAIPPDGSASSASSTTSGSTIVMGLVVTGTMVMPTDAGHD